MSEITLSVSVPERQLQRARAQANLKTRFPAVLKTPRAEDRLSLWSKVIEHIGPAQPVTILDFGVF